MRRGPRLPDLRRRVSKTAGRGPIALVASGLQQHSHRLWFATAQTLEGLFRRTGLPAYGVEVGAFVGDYQTTPFGVHQDEVEVFMYMVEGTKGIRFWRPTDLTEHQVMRHGREYGPVKRKSFLLRAREGDLLYWPSTHWHVGEPSGFSVSLNIAVGVTGGTPSQINPRGTPAQLTAAVTRGIIKEMVGDPLLKLPVPSPRRREYALTPTLRRSLHAATRVGDEAHSRLLAEQLARITGFGFVPPPPLLTSLRVPDSAQVVVNRQVPIVWGATPVSLVIAASGHVWYAPNHPGLVSMLRQIRTRGGHSVRELLRAFPNTARVNRATVRVERALARRLLTMLCQTGALSLDCAPPSARPRGA